ncbi:O-antigen ligase family protein [Trinickia diaoshuihuensis]|uniref:O-antigen ligase family protein n=1 Tax=Trinickia diaoshuihuensis TaxID=2292265 RepID=UPI000E2277F9|nr:O-antigen ligase family protein [Trinickia diaoshuihuensis]
MQHVSSANPPSYRLTAARAFAVAALCCVPISTALTNIACGLFAVALLSAPEFWRKLPAMLRHGAVWSTLLILAALAASASYSSAGTHEAWSWFGKYYKLLLLPFGVIAFADSRADWDVLARWSLFVTLCVVLALSTTNYLGLTSLGPAHVASDPSTRAWVFKNRIAAGLIGALLFYQAADFALAAGTWRSRIMFATIALLSLINVLVMLQGRTGQAIAVLFMLAVAARIVWQMRGGSPWRLILCSCALLAAVAVLVAVAVTARGSRIGEVAGEVKAYRESDATTSTGLRLEWYRKSVDLIRARPLTGYGVGGLGAEFAQLTKGETGAEGAMTLNPHNEYLLMAVQLGLPGIVLLVNLIVQVARYGVRLEPRSRHLLLAWLATFAIGSLANSLLLDFTEGHLFALLSGILLGCGYRSAGAARPGVSSPG